MVRFLLPELGDTEAIGDGEEIEEIDAALTGSTEMIGEDATEEKNSTDEHVEIDGRSEVARSEDPDRRETMEP